MPPPMSSFCLELTCQSGNRSSILDRAPEKVWGRAPKLAVSCLAMSMKKTGNHSFVSPSVRKLDPASTIAKLEQAASEGNPDAAAMLVRIYENGISVPRNEQRARGWKLVAANSSF